VIIIVLPQEAHYFLKRHVDRAALKKWGSQEKLDAEKAKRAQKLEVAKKTKSELAEKRKTDLEASLRLAGFGKWVCVSLMYFGHKFAASSCNTLQTSRSFEFARTKRTIQRSQTHTLETWGRSLMLISSKR
jgi:hypothetical protein